MASELRVNTLKDAAGANSVAMEYVAGGSAKAWCNFNGQGTVAFRNSLNCTSLVDNGTGDYEVSYVSNLVDIGYSMSFSSIATTSSRAGAFIGSKVTALGTPNAVSQGNILTSGHHFQCAYGSDASNHGAATNPDAVCLDINGDLA
jgi:hypothetical protein